MSNKYLRAMRVLLILRLRATTKLSLAREGLRNIDLLTPATRQVSDTTEQQGISVVRTVPATSAIGLSWRCSSVLGRNTRSAVSSKVPSVVSRHYIAERYPLNATTRLNHTKRIRLSTLAKHPFNDSIT